MNRIETLFGQSNRKLLSVFYTAGFPTLDSTATIARQLQAAGADLIEIGIPFSDPIADGPVIQESNSVALRNGMTLRLLLGQVAEIRKCVTIPILLMGYLNPVLQYGIEKFLADASEAGVDGLILPDLPLAEFNIAYKELFIHHRLATVFLIAPSTSEERIRRIDDLANGFLYAVSSSSITGAKGDFTDEQMSYFTRLEQMKLKNPVLTGFGISNAITYEKASRHSRGAIVGSAFISMMKKSKDLDSDIVKFLEEIRGKFQIA